MRQILLSSHFSISKHQRESASCQSKPQAKWNNRLQSKAYVLNSYTKIPHLNLSWTDLTCWKCWYTMCISLLLLVISLKYITPKKIPTSSLTCCATTPTSLIFILKVWKRTWELSLTSYALTSQPKKDLFLLLRMKDLNYYKDISVVINIKLRLLN